MEKLNVNLNKEKILTFGVRTKFNQWPLFEICLGDSQAVNDSA